MTYLSRPARPSLSPYHRSAGALRSVSGQGLGSGDCPSLETLEQRTLMAVDAVTPNHPVWAAVSGTAKVDGVIKADEWANAVPIVRAQPNRHDSAATVRMMWDDEGLYISADIRDAQVWADGSGGGSGRRWEFFEDDGVAFYFDPTRNAKLTARARAIGYNAAKMNASTSGSGAVSRWDYFTGTGKGQRKSVILGGALAPGIVWANKIKGKANSNAKSDTGWTTEVFMPWAALNMSRAPRNGQTINSNFDVYFDNDGGIRNGASQGTKDSVDLRFGPRVLDDQIHGAHSSTSTNDPGMHGPVSYAQLVFVDSDAHDTPGAIQDLEVTWASGYGAKLGFTAPAGSASGRGSATGYAVRVAPTAITTQADWDAATPVENSFVPHVKGQRESLRLAELTPGSNYSVAVRAVDAAGRLGPIAMASLTTDSADADPSEGNRIVPSPGGDRLMTESGEPFTIVGSMVGVRAMYLRQLYTGLLWRNGELQNFNQDPPLEGTAAEYFAEMRANGVNTLRVQLERVEETEGHEGQWPLGMPWLEQPAGNYNPDMRQFLLNVLEEADQAGIYVTLQTFNSFNYERNFELSPYAKANGGPLDRIEDFYGSPEVLAMAEQRMSVLAGWVQESPYAHRMIGFELVNEWDGLNRVRGEPLAKEVERSRFILALSDHLRSVAPELLVMSATIEQAPRGPMARAVFYSDAFDVLAPHFYVPSIAEPVNNPDSDVSVRPAIDYGALAAYWMTNRRDNRPIHNSEWNLVKDRWPQQPGGARQVYYTGITDNDIAGKPFLLSEDEAIYRTQSWSSLASGLSGNGMRLGGSALEAYWDQMEEPDDGALPVPLSAGMHDIQRSVEAFFADTTLDVDWNGMDYTPLSGRIKLGRTGGKRVLAWGVGDGENGMAYVLKDGASGGTVAEARMNVEGMLPGRTYTVQVWSAGANAQVVSTLTAIANAAGKVAWTLPAFETDLVMKFMVTS